MAGRAAEPRFRGRSSPRSTPALSASWRRRLPRARRSSRRRTGRRRRRRWSPRSSAAKVTLAHNRAGANLVSGVASALLAADGRRSRPLRGRRGRAPRDRRAIRPQAVCLGNLFRDQLDRYGEVEHVAEALARRRRRARPGRHGGRERRRSAARRHRPRARGGAARSGSTIPRVARDRAPPRRRLEVLPHLRRALRVRGRLRRPPRRLPLPALPRGAPDARRRRPGDRALRARELVLRPGDAGGNASRLDRAPRALQRLQRARAASLSLVARRRRSTRSRPASAAFSAAFGRFERIMAGERTVLLLLVKNPAGANEVVRTLVDAGAPARARDRAERRDRGRARRILDLGRRLRAADRLARAAGGRAARGPRSSRFASSTAGSTPSAIELVPDLGRGARPRRSS